MRLSFFGNNRTRQKLARHFRNAALLGAVFVLLVTFAWNTLGQPGKPKPPGLFLDIQEVFVADPFDLVDADGGVIDIYGENLDFGDGPLVVTLGLIGALVCDTAGATATHIVCTIPIGGVGAAGDYLLTVSNGFGQSENDEYDLTIAEPPVPDGTIAFFNGDCPPGWTEFAALQGRVALGVTSNGTIGGTVGTALADSDTPNQHNHSISDDGEHTHTLTEPTATADAEPDGLTVASSTHVHNTIASGVHNHSGMTGDTDTGHPYVQLRACSKDAL